MLSRTVLALKSTIPLAAKGAAFEGIPRCTAVWRDYPAEATVPLPEKTESPAQESIQEPTAPTSVHRETKSKRSGVDAYSLLEDDSDYAVSMAKAVRESDNVFRRAEGEEPLGEKQEVSAENVSAMNFEDAYFRLDDEMNYRFVQDNINYGLNEKAFHTGEDTTFVSREDANALFDAIMAKDPNTVLTEEEKKRLSLEREEVKEEEKEVKRNTWFNFMPAKEKPEGLFGSYSPDQIFSSLEWDLLSRNAREVYKYEKDDMLLTEEVLQHAKMPEPVAAPAIPKYPNLEKYAQMVAFAVNRNGDYSMEEKQKIMDILAKVGSLDSDVDDSPKSEFKERKNL
ncbi:hypothetical protein WA577_002232 [Blastocystis sp. JDR]